MTAADKHPFAQLMAALAIAHRESPPDAPTLRVYFGALQDIDIEFVDAAARRLMTTAKWFPKAAEWHAQAVQIEASRRDAQRALLRRLPTPLCAACDDTSWRSDGDGVRPCECRETRRLELLGRLPWPERAEAELLPLATGITADETAATLADLRRWFKPVKAHAEHTGSE